MTNEAKRILIAEDNAALLCLLRVTLSKAGFDVVAVHNGGEAWALLNQSHFDLVVTDYQMPGMDGFELCKLMRTSAEWAQIPVLLLTAKMFELDVSELQKELGFFTVVPKPFSPRELTRLVQDRLRTCAV
jgi:CheY-like chemotaxis protein